MKSAGPPRKETAESYLGRNVGKAASPERRERERERVGAGVDPPDVAIWCSFQRITCCWPVLGLDIHGFLERLQMRVSEAADSATVAGLASCEWHLGSHHGASVLQRCPAPSHAPRWHKVTLGCAAYS